MQVQIIIIIIIFSPLNIKREKVVAAAVVGCIVLYCIVQVPYFPQRARVFTESGGANSYPQKNSFPFRFLQVSLRYYCGEISECLFFFPSHYYISTYKSRSTTGTSPLYSFLSLGASFFLFIFFFPPPRSDKEKGAVWGVRRGLGQDN